MLIGLIGKANVGKSTFFTAATDTPVSIGNYPFTTIKPNTGVGYARTNCVCKEFGVIDNPIHSLCIDGTRFVPIELIDVAGLVPGAHEGRGLGNQFLDDARQADGLIHVVDISGSTDSEGHYSSPGTFDALEDIKFVEDEFDLWVVSIIKRDWQKNLRELDSVGPSAGQILKKRLSGLGIKESIIEKIRIDMGLVNKKISSWSEEEIFTFCKNIRKQSKPMIIAGNKADISSKSNLEKITEKYGLVIPCASEAESLLRKASKFGLIYYLPGDCSFKIIDNEKLNERQKKALDLVSRFIKKNDSTGVQKTIDILCFEILKKIVVYPVEDEMKLTDKKGNILPEAYIMDENGTAKDLAYHIHEDLGKGFLFAIDVRTKKRIGSDHKLKHRDVIKIVSTMSRS